MGERFHTPCFQDKATQAIYQAISRHQVSNYLGFSKLAYNHHGGDNELAKLAVWGVAWGKFFPSVAKDLPAPVAFEVMVMLKTHHDSLKGNLGLHQIPLKTFEVKDRARPLVIKNEPLDY